MSKPSFKMPRRTEQAGRGIDQWVHGAESVTAEQAPAPRPERPAGKPARLTIDLPPELHAKFKATCALRGTRMIDEVRKLIESWIQKNS